MVNEVASVTFRADSRDVRGATKDLDRMSGAAGRSEKAARTMARNVRAAFAGLGVGLVIRGIIQHTVEQEKATAQLEATLRSTGRYTPQLSQALQDYARQLQSVTTFGDEAIIVAQSQLATFTKLGSDVFPRATEAALDLSTKMGTDLKESIVQVGKALQDPILGITALRRVGVNFSDAQKDVIKNLLETNRLAEAQALILDELEVEFGGSARAARDTFGGALKGVQNALGDLLEADADSLPALTDSLNELEAALNDPQVKAGFQNLTGALVTVIRVTAEAAAGFATFGANLGELFGRIAAGSTGSLEAITARLAELRQELDTGNTGGFTGIERVLGLFDGPVSEQRRREIEAEIAKLEELRSYYAEPINAPEVVVPDLSGLDAGGSIDEITLDLPDKMAESREYLNALKRLQEDGREATEELRGALNSLAADMGGPVVQAGLRLSDTLAMLDEYEQRLANSNQLTAESQQQLASARALAVQQHERELELIEAQLSPAEELLEQLRLETELIGLSNVEREKRLALQLAGSEATAEELAEIDRLIEKKARLEETERAANELRSAGEDALASFISGSKSASDAFESFADSVIASVARMLAEKAIAALFGGGFGAAPGGEAGGLFGSVLSGIFGPGRALGGSVTPGRIYPVNERGDPEVLTVGQRQYLLTGNQGGQVQPITNTVNHGSTSITVNLPPEERRRSAAALSAHLMREASRAAGRNR